MGAVDQNERYYRALFETGDLIEKSTIAIDELKRCEYRSPHLNNDQQPCRIPRPVIIVDQLKQLIGAVQKNDKNTLKAYVELGSGRVHADHYYVQLNFRSEEYIERYHRCPCPHKRKILAEFILVSVLGGSYTSIYGALKEHTAKLVGPPNPTDTDHPIETFRFSNQADFNKVLFFRNNSLLKPFLSHLSRGAQVLFHRPSEEYRNEVKKC